MAALPRKSTQLAHSPLRHRAEGDEGMISAIARMAEAAGAPPTRLMGDFAGLAIGPGRVDFADYERMRLYDEGFWGETDRREIAGVRRGRDLALAINFRHDCFALAVERLASNIYLSAHGLPTQPILAIYRQGLATPGANLIRTREELRAFLESRRAVAMSAQQIEGGAVRKLFGPGRDGAADIASLLSEVRDAGHTSWLLQPRLTPHPDAAAGDGERLTPVRLLIANGDYGPIVLRALWRLGGRDDIVARLDLDTGAVLSIFPAASPHRAETAPRGFCVPDWPQLKATAIEGARLMGQFGLLGWDVAPTDAGPVILGLDPTPDVTLHQLADRAGLLDPWFLDFVSERRRLAADHRRLA